MNDTSKQSLGLWELSVLAVLRERPMHPYEIQRLLRERHKDEFLRLNRGSLYHAIRRLEAAGLISEKETTREGLRPERTTYAITKTGAQTFVGWLKQLLAVPQPEVSSFAASISFLVYLSPAEAIVELENRITRLEEQIRQFEVTITTVGPIAGRINLIECEYSRAMAQAEVKWVRQVIGELRSKKLTWDLEEILRQLRAVASPHRQSKKPIK